MFSFVDQVIRAMVGMGDDACKLREKWVGTRGTSGLVDLAHKASEQNDVISQADFRLAWQEQPRPALSRSIALHGNIISTLQLILVDVVLTPHHLRMTSIFRMAESTGKVLEGVFGEADSSPDTQEDPNTTRMPL